MKNLFLLASIGIFSCTSKTEIKTKVEHRGINASYVSYKMDKPEYTYEQIKFLKEKGLTGSLTVKENQYLLDAENEKFYKEKFGLKFISNEFLEYFLSEDSLIRGPLNFYGYKIPSKNVTEFQNNFNKIVSIDSNFEEYYFIRTHRERGRKFIQKIPESEVNLNKENEIKDGPIISSDEALKNEFYKKYLDKYRRDFDMTDYVTDFHNGSAIEIIAPKEYFNITGQSIVNNTLQPIVKDPAIIIQVPNGWLCLTAW